MKLPTQSINALARSGYTPDEALHVPLVDLLRIPRLGPKGIAALAYFYYGNPDKKYQTPLRPLTRGEKEALALIKELDGMELNDEQLNRRPYLTLVERSLVIVGPGRGPQNAWHRVTITPPSLEV